MKIAELKRIAGSRNPYATLRRNRWGENEGTRGTWAYHRGRFLAFFSAFYAGKLDLDRARTPFKVFGAGNKKLPFRTFSSLFAVDCPGAGECLQWCYSPKGWRYPAVFLRALQNSLLLASEDGHAIIRREWLKLRPGVVRLYVDGDIKDTATLRFWMELCRERPDLAVYGYSKSWECFLELDDDPTFAWPRNYKVNVSSGSRYDGTPIADAFRKLDCVRGDFIAIDMAGQPDTAQALRERARAQLGKAQIFACPGQCGACMPNGAHACGSERMHDVDVVIAIH